MKTDNIERYLESFGKNVVADSKKLLSSAKGDTALGKSIRVKVVKRLMVLALNSIWQIMVLF